MALKEVAIGYDSPVKHESIQATLNRHLPEHGSPRLMILSCPKTGNVWVRWLLHHAYGVPQVELPNAWSDEAARGLPSAFVTHQHLRPVPELVEWMALNRVTVITTVRHPADTLLSYFHFIKWAGAPGDPAKRTISDGDRPGDLTLDYARGTFADTYSISLEWARLGAKVVRFESLLENPVMALRALAAAIAPVDDERAVAAALLSKPDQLFASGVDRRHIRTGSSGRWKRELRADIVQAMAGMSTYREACDAFGYDWDTHGSDPPSFDYASIDPFGGRATLDNGVPIGPWMARIYLMTPNDERERWPDPAVTAGKSFWNWLASPRELPSARGDSHPRLPNLVWALRELRPDLRAAFPDPAADRDRLLDWFFEHGIAEYGISPELALPIRREYPPS